MDLHIAVPGPRQAADRDSRDARRGPHHGGCAAAAFDYLEMPADAGLALLGRGLPTGPVEHDAAAREVRLRVPAGSAEELPALLEWLEWGGVTLELTARRGPRCGGCAADPAETGSGSRGVVTSRPPEPGGGVDLVRGADLVRLVSAAATECHRARLRRNAEPPRTQPFSFSYASRTVAGTRPRSLTS